MARTTTPPSARRAASSRRASQPLTAVLPTRLPVPITPSDGRGREAREGLRPHLRVGGLVGGALGERGAHEQEALAIADDGLVGEIDERLGARRAQRGAHALEDLVGRLGPRLHRDQAREADLRREGGQAVGGRESRRGGSPPPRSFSRPPAKMPPTHRVRVAEPGERGGDHRRVVLAVDEHDGARQARGYRPSPSGIGQMYLSKLAVDGTKSISVSSPWKGYLRATRTRSSSMRMRL